MRTSTTKEYTIQPFEILSSDNSIKNWELPQKLRYYGYWFRNSKGDWIFDDVRVKTPMAVIGKESKYYKLVVGAWKKINAYTELRKWSSKTEKPFNYSSKRRPKIHKEVVTELNKKWQEYIELRPHSKEWYKSKHPINWKSEKRLVSSKGIVKLEREFDKSYSRLLAEDPTTPTYKTTRIIVQVKNCKKRAANLIKDPEIKRLFYHEKSIIYERGTKYCQVCGNLVAPSKHAWNKRYCSEGCQLIAQNNRFIEQREQDMRSLEGTKDIEKRLSRKENQKEIT